MLLPFNEQQLIHLSQYPPDALEHANKTITRELHSGKVINNQFAYFEAIVKSFLKSPSARSNPQSQRSTSNSNKPRANTFSPYAQGGKWIPGVEIINNPRNFQTDITHVETELEFATNYEKLIHKNTLKDPAFAKKASRYDKNPIWDKFTPDQQTNIWKEAHGQSCFCRKNEQAGLLMPEIAEKLSNKFKDSK